MKDKKNIDRLFQELFKDFEAEPTEQVWKNIQTSLKEEKKERKIIPIWFRNSGIAAAFFLGLFTLTTLLNTNSGNKDGIVLGTNPLDKSLEQNTIISVKKGEPEINPSSLKINSKSVVTTIKKTFRNYEKNTPIILQSKPMANKEANKSNSSLHITKNNTPLEEYKIVSEQNALENKLVQTEKSIKTKLNASDPFLNETAQKDILDTKKETLFVQANSSNTKEQTLTLEFPNELDELLKKKEAEESKKNSIVLNQKNKWQITPNVAQLYLNANSGGSPIDDQLSDYDRKSNNSLSYGIGVQYAVYNKIVLRTGINKVVLGYDTDNVMYSTGLTANNLTNISYSSDNAIKFINETDYNSLSPSEKVIQNTNTGTINQKMGYYEIPLELSYSILDKKFVINLIGGLSTLFLNENTILLVSSQSKIELGEAKNLSKVHFSTNFGLGFKYQLIKSFQLSFEPVLKYQFNAFSKDSNNFSPLYIGLYSGVSYKF